MRNVTSSVLSTAGGCISSKYHFRKPFKPYQRHSWGGNLYTKNPKEFSSFFLLKQTVQILFADRGGRRLKIGLFCNQERVTRPNIIVPKHFLCLWEGGLYFPRSLSSRFGFVTCISQWNVIDWIDEPPPGGSFASTWKLWVRALHFVFFSCCPDDQQCSGQTVIHLPSS